MRACFCLVLLSMTAAAQVGGNGGPVPNQNSPGTRASRPATPSAPEDLCTVQGQVMNAATGEPLKKANLTLQRTDATPDMMSMPVSYSTTSDAAGKFAMKDIEAGKYRLSVNRNGFVTTAYGARAPNRPGTTLTLLKGQSAKDIVFKLTPHGVVTGRILDEDGEAISNVRVQLMNYRYQQGRKQLAYASGASSDDLGQYRIFGVAPGKYYLSATFNPQSFGPVQDRSAAPQPEEDYVPTYYPGTTEVATAAQLEVAPGGQVQGIDLKLTKAHTVHVKGHVAYTVPGKQRVMVYVFPRSGGMSGPIPLRPTQPDAKGDFDLRGVAPGSYLVTAIINEGQKIYQGRSNVEVGNTNVENVSLMIGSGMEVTGQVTTEGPDTPDLSSARVFLQTRDNGIMFGAFSQARVEDGHSFKLPDVSAGVFTVILNGLPSGYYVKSIRSEQTDVMVNGLNTESPVAPLQVVLSPNAAQVSGTVQNHETGNAAPGATVVLVPQEKERKELQNHYKQVSSDQNGSFTFKDVMPGEYKVYAWEDLESGAYMDPDFMKPVEGKGESLSLREKDQKAVQLTLIAAESSGGKRGN